MTSLFPRSVSAAAVLMLLSLGGCAALNEKISGDKVDYKGTVNRSTALEVPPDLTQLNAESRFSAPATGTAVSASTYQPAGTSAAAGATQVAPQSVGDVRIERQGALRWLSTPMAPEQLWPKLQSFWEERKLSLVTDKPEVGVMETEWAENRAKLPLDFIRGTIGKVLDKLYSTGELDKYRVRVERTATGSEIYITHHGMQESYAGSAKDSTVWEPRPRDPQLEGEMLSLLMIKLGSKPDQAKEAVAASATALNTPARARIISGTEAASLQVDDSFDRAWRRVGLALDRSGFTVEDRDRGQGLYFVRYVDPALAGQDEPGFFSKLFGIGDKNSKQLARYRVSVRSEGEATVVSVLTDGGAPEKGEAGQRIVKLLLDDLK